jgi:RNA polymerase sigma-70 factor (ECF subfamily)
MLTHEHLDGFSDDVLLQQIGDGCEECFALLFHCYFRQVFGVAFKILRERSEAEDILKEVFLSIRT